MNKIIFFITLFLFSCVPDNRPRSPTYFSWGNKDFSIDIEKGYARLEMCPLELTLKNHNSKSFSSVYIELTAYDDSEVNIGSTNFLVSIGPNETLKRNSYITKHCIYVHNLKLSKFTFR
jgi:hypothetical protein